MHLGRNYKLGKLARIIIIDTNIIITQTIDIIITEHKVHIYCCTRLLPSFPQHLDNMEVMDGDGLAVSAVRALRRVELPERQRPLHAAAAIGVSQTLARQVDFDLEEDGYICVYMGSVSV